MEEFRFANEGKFLWLLVLPALYSIAYLARKWTFSRLQKFAHANNLAWIAGKLNYRTLTTVNKVQLFALALVILALARPQANPVVQDISTEGLDIIIALDISRSMDAEDIHPSRLRKAKKTISNLLDKLGGDRVGIVAFAGSAFLICPLTSDYDVIKTFLGSVDTTLIDNQGTNVGAAIREARDAFKRGAQNSLNTETPGHMIVVMSDGEETEGDAVAEAKKAREDGIVIHALAYGSEKGVPIPIRDNQGVLVAHKRDRVGETVLTKVSLPALKEVAEAGGGLAGFSGIEDAEIDDILNAAKLLSKSADSHIQTKIYEELFSYPLFLAIIILLVCFGPARIPFRRTSVALIAILLTSQNSWANEEISLPWYSVFWNSQKRAIELSKKYLENKKSDQATSILQQEQAKDPSSERLNYNLGAALAQSGKFEEAQKQIDQQLSKENSYASAFSHFNAAGIAKQKNDLAGAATHLFKAIDDLENRGTLDENQRNLLTQSRKNLELIFSKNKQNQQNQQNQQGQQDPKDGQKQGQQGDQKNNSGEDKNKNDQSKDDKKDSENNKKDEQDSKESDNSQDKRKANYGQTKRKFEDRSDLSESDAKRILESLKNHESNLQKKFIKNSINKMGKEKEKEADNGKDW